MIHGRAGLQLRFAGQPLMVQPIDAAIQTPDADVILRTDGSRLTSMNQRPRSSLALPGMQRQKLFRSTVAPNSGRGFRMTLRGVILGVIPRAINRRHLRCHQALPARC